MIADAEANSAVFANIRNGINRKFLRKSESTISAIYKYFEDMGIIGPKAGTSLFL
jgi:hypothetical protein